MSNSVLRQLPADRIPRALALDWAVLAAPLALLAAVILVAAPNGSYFPSSWGWSALAFLWVAMLALVMARTNSLSRLQAAYLIAWFGLLGWTAASLIWSPTTTQTMYEIERAVVYMSFALALLLVGRRSFHLFLPALLAAIVAVAAYALATRLLPDRVGSFDSFVGYRLSEPLGYWNALAAFVAIGICVGVGLAAHARPVVVRVLAAASLVLLFPVLYFTFSRGGWIALGAGLAAAVVIDPGRLRLVTTLLVALPWPGLALWRAYESPGLTTQYSMLADASKEGSRLALTLAVLAAISAVVMAGFSMLADRITVGAVVRRVYAAILVLALIGCIAGVVAAYGGPVESTRRALDSIRLPPPEVRGDQTRRLFSLSANGRLQTWEAALDDARENPVLGSGAGTFERWWLEHREIAMKVRDAHSVYVETLAELGPVGLVALLAIVGLPLAAAVRVRRHPVVAAGSGGFVALVVHAGFDWDWEMPAVMIAGLTCAGVLLLADAAEQPRAWTLGPVSRASCVALVGILGALSFVTLTGNRYLGQAGAALNRTDGEEAARKAARAERWAPWSTEALKRQGDAALLDGSVQRARSLYREAVAKDPGDWELWLGVALSSEGDARRRALGRAASLNPLATEIEQLREQFAVRNVP